MPKSFLEKIFGSKNDRELKRIQPLVQQINSLEPQISQMSDAELRAFTPRLKERLAQGASLEDILPEAFAVVREVSRRTIHLRPFDVQLIGGVVLHQGKIAEMKTGEGKTLVATLPAYLTPSRIRAFTSSPSTITWPNATRNGWAPSSNSSA